MSGSVMMGLTLVMMNLVLILGWYVGFKLLKSRREQEALWEAEELASKAEYNPNFAENDELRSV